MEHPIPPEGRAAASDVPPVLMELTAACEIRERVWLDAKYMIGSEEEDDERCKRFLAENPISTTDRYPPILKRLKKLGHQRRIDRFVAYLLRKKSSSKNVG